MNPVRRYLVGAIAILASIVVFIVPFIFIILTALKTRKDASLRGFTLPLRRHPWLTIMDAPVAGWRAERVESGVRLTPVR